MHTLCAAATRQVVDYIVGGELHGTLPLGGAVTESELGMPPLHDLVRASLLNCASRGEWHLAMQDYVDGGAVEMDPIFLEGCGVEQHFHEASAHTDGAVVIPIPAACR